MLQNVAYRSAVLPEVYPQLPHGPDDGHQALDGVAEHHGLALQALFKGAIPLTRIPADPESNPANFRGSKMVASEPSLVLC